MITRTVMTYLKTHRTKPRGILTCLAMVGTTLLAHGQSKQSPAPIYVQTELSSKHLITGEQTYLKISIQNSNQGLRPSAPEIPNTAVNFSGNRVEIDGQRRITRSFIYRIRPAKPGSYTVPPISFNGSRSQYSGKPLSFEVRDANELAKVSSGITGQDIRVGWFPEKTKLYAGEQCPLTLKIYVPSKLRPTSWGLPEAEKNNCLAWRFSGPTRDDLGEVVINNTAYISAPFKTTLSGISAGNASFGPTRMSIVSRQRSIDPRRGIRISDVPYKLTLPSIDFDIMPLPAGAPAGFKGAIGQFNIGVECKKASIKDTDTLEVLLRIQGEGNLENIQAPELNGTGWKVIDTSKVTRGGERRRSQGAVTFRQILRPVAAELSGKLPSNIPAYSMSVFNPDNQSYYTLSTAPIPINISPTLDSSVSSEPKITALVDPASLRPEQMKDILGFIKHSVFTPQQDTASLTRQLQPQPIQMLQSYWQLLPALICLSLITIPVLTKIKSSRQKPSTKASQRQALKDIASAEDRATFYRRAGRFIEQRLTVDDELKTILTERDQLCFSLKDDSQDQEPISPQRKQEITDILKRHAKQSISLLIASIIGLALIPSNQLQAAQNASNGNGSLPSSVSAKHSTEHSSPTSSIGTIDTLCMEALNAIDQGQYQKAIDLYQQAFPTIDQALDPTLNKTPADVLYNIGNCHYQLGQLDQPGQLGQAALAWRRALAQQSDHLQARKNLRYLELKEGAFSPVIEQWQQKITTLPLSLYQNLYRASLW
ncbi:MAG: BatD family protein, partial [Akkermansiaceae bacterium]